MSMNPGGLVSRNDLPLLHQFQTTCPTFGLQFTSGIEPSPWPENSFRNYIVAMSHNSTKFSIAMLEGSSHGDSSLELAKCYSEISDLQKEHGKDLIEKLSLEKNMKILDLGCGTGYLSALLADSVGPAGKVVAVDPNKSRLELAKKQYSRSNLVFLEANDVTFPEDEYDLVFSNYVLHWIENKNALFKRVYQNLKPGGQFAFVVSDQQPTIAEQMDDLMGPEMKQCVHWMSASEYNHLATAVGFKVTYSVVQNKPVHFENIESLMQFYRGSTDGRFNPQKIEPAILETFKQPFGDSPIDIDDFHQVTIILTKFSVNMTGST